MRVTGSKAVMGVLAAAATLAVMLAPSPVMAHGGGTDDRGCHNSSASGRYHCHSGPYDGQSFSSEEAFLRHQAAGSAGKRPTPSPGDSGYDREDYHRSWLDRDSDCQDTLEEVLIRQSREPVTFASERGCDVVAGLWVDPYSGETFTDPGDLDIDHLVPLAEAHQSGAASWPQSRKHTYANDLKTHGALIAVHLSENRSKGAKDPDDWMPSNEGFHCRYLQLWVDVKERWSLRMDAEEKAFVSRKLDQCSH